MLLANSALAAGLALVLSKLIDSGGRMIFGVIFDRAPIFYHNRVELTVAGSDLAGAGGALAALLAGIIFLSAYPASRTYDTSRIAVLWLILNCFRQGLVQLAETPFNADSDLARVLVSLDAPPGLDLVVGATGGVGLLLVFMAAAPAFLAFAPYRSDIATPFKRLVLVARVALLPAMVGALIAVPMLLPDPGTGLVQSLPLQGLFTAVTLVAAPGTKSVEGPRERQHRPLSWALLATVIATFIVLRFVLARGIPVPPNPQDFFAS
jgi:hypothetical protein